MTLMFIFGGLLILMICLLLAPTSVTGLLQSGVPSEARTSPSQYPVLPVVAIFGLGIFLFNQISTMLSKEPSFSYGAFETKLLWITGVFFAANGVFACFVPIEFMRFYVQQLRKIPASQLDIRARSLIMMTAKSFGVICILAAAFIVHSIYLK